MKTKLIEVPIYFNDQDKPTCRLAHQKCMFYSTEKWGTIERCIYTTKEIERSENHMGIERMGYTQPTAGCPLHETNGATDEP